MLSLHVDLLAVAVGESLWVAQWIALNRPAGTLPPAEFWLYDPDVEVVVDAAIDEKPPLYAPA